VSAAAADAFAARLVGDAAAYLGPLIGYDAGGRYLCLEVACNERLEDNFGPLGALQHGVSVLYCLSTSLALRALPSPLSPRRV